MDMNEYQNKALGTAVYPQSTALAYTALGLCGEAGEFANKLKKVFREDEPLDRYELAKELGDILWYVAAIAHELSYDLNGIAATNLQKLADRAARNQIKGSGDNR